MAESIRIVVISDTHSREGAIPEIPLGDILIHAGDFSNVGAHHEMVAFREFMDRQPHAQKIVIAGNHDITMQPDFYRKVGRSFHPKLFQQTDFNPDEYSLRCRSCVTDSQSDSYTYLEDSACSARRQGVDCGLKVWGSPWQPEFCDWAFNLPPGPRLKEKWAMIESDTDILITHGPPRGILDANSQRYHCGCADLLKAVRDRVKPRLHIFGHIHESYGTFSDGHTLFVNGSTCTLSYRPSNPPIVIDLPLDVNMPAQVVGQSSEKENDIYATP